MNQKEIVHKLETFVKLNADDMWTHTIDFLENLIVRIKGE